MCIWLISCLGYSSWQHVVHAILRFTMQPRMVLDFQSLQTRPQSAGAARIEACAFYKVLGSTPGLPACHADGLCTGRQRQVSSPSFNCMISLTSRHFTKTSFKIRIKGKGHQSMSVTCHSKGLWVGHTLPQHTSLCPDHSDPSLNPEYQT